MKFVSIVINGFDVKVAFDENSVHIYNAYPIKDELKLRGYRWDPLQKTWYNDRADVESELAVLNNNLKSEQIEQIEQIVKKPNERLFNIDKKESKTTDMPKSSSVSELRNRLHRIITNYVEGNIWVRGVIASELKNYNWASYFDLKDENDLNDVYFSSEIKVGVLSSINYKLKKMGVADNLSKDLPVLLLVKVELSHKKNINIRLSVIDILPEFTREKIKNQREVTIDKLQGEGILENQKKKSLPLLVRNIGLITSEQGTSIRDILAGMDRYSSKYDINFIDARMEGDNAVATIIKAIEYFEMKETPPDLIVIARGGGSEQSLSVFNDYKLCKKVCKSEIPVLTAIGHEKDFSAIELCSFLTPSPSTPSGIGKYFFDRYLELQKKLLEMFNKIANLSSILLKDHRYAVHKNISSISLINKRLILDSTNKINNLVKFIFLRTTSFIKNKNTAIKGIIAKVQPKRIIENNDVKKDSIINTVNTIIDYGKRVFKSEYDILQQKQFLIKASDPQKILKRGFTLTIGKNGKIITSKEKFTDENALLRFYDGEVKINKIGV